MNKQKNALLKGSKETSQSLAKKAIHNEHRIEEEKTLPIYIVVSSKDKNDDILIVHCAYPVEPFQNSRYTGSNIQNDKTELPIDKPVRPIKRINRNISSDTNCAGDKTIMLKEKS